MRKYTYITIHSSLQLPNGIQYAVLQTWRPHSASRSQTEPRKPKPKPKASSENILLLDHYRRSVFPPFLFPANIHFGLVMGTCLSDSEALANLFGSRWANFRSLLAVRSCSLVAIPESCLFDPGVRSRILDFLPPFGFEALVDAEVEAPSPSPSMSTSIS